MGEPLVTIFTQAYNVEKYIAQCIESVLGQTYGDFEWILVENGSTDDTRNIIRTYARKDSRIKCIYLDVNSHGFPNEMIANFAKGEYVAKLDSDDFWDSTYLEKLVRAMENIGADLVCCKAIVLDEVNNQRYYHGFRKYEGIVTEENVAEQYREIEIDMNTHWAKLMKRDLFIRACSTYRELYQEKTDIVYGGDTIFMYCYLNECKKSMFLMDALYFYRLHRKNASKIVIDINMFENCLTIFEVKRRFLQKLNAWNEQNSAMVYNAFWGNIDTLFTNIVKNEVLDNRRKMELMGEVLSDERMKEKRREYWDEQIRKKLSTHIAWCYMNMEKESENIFLKMLMILEPELFCQIAEKQYQFLMTEKILLALIILGEKEEILQHLEKLNIEYADEEYGICSYVHDWLI